MGSSCAYSGSGGMVGIERTRLIMSVCVLV